MSRGTLTDPLLIRIRKTDHPATFQENGMETHEFSRSTVKE